MVGDLIDQQTRQWNIRLISQFFPPTEVDLMREIPLTRANFEDVRIWELEKNGIYSVKSCYYML